MTLSEKLSEYIKKYRLTGVETARRADIDPTQVSDIRLRNKYSPATAEKIYKAFGNEFKEFLEYDTCPYCGESYIRQTNIQKTCLASDCVKKHRAIVAKEYLRKVNSGEHVKQTCNERRRPIKRENAETASSKPKATYAEYNERARSQGLSYGQLQGLERLGLR